MILRGGGGCKAFSSFCLQFGHRWRKNVKKSWRKEGKLFLVIVRTKNNYENSKCPYLINKNVCCSWHFSLCIHSNFIPGISQNYNFGYYSMRENCKGSWWLSKLWSAAKSLKWPNGCQNNEFGNIVCGKIVKRPGGCQNYDFENYGLQ